MKIEDEHFDKLYGVAKESSDRTRSALYVFLVVNFGLFITVFGANIYNRPQERLKDFEKAKNCSIFLPGEADSDTLDCNTAKEDALDHGYVIGPEGKAGEAPGSKAVDKRIEALVTEEVATKKVQIPIIGFGFDIDYLWILTCYFGPLAMIIVLASTQNETRIISRIINLLREDDKPNRIYRYTLLSSTQVLVTSRPDGGVPDWAGKLQYYSRIGFLRSIFLMPIVTQAIIIYYDLGVDEALKCFMGSDKSCHAYKVDVISEFKRHAVLEFTQFSVEIFALVFMVSLSVQFLRTTTELRKQFALVAKRVVCLDRE